MKHITGKPATQAESWSRLLRYAGHWNLVGYGYWAICLKADESYLGEAGFLRIDPPDDADIDAKPEAGWVLGSAHTGMGYGLEAMTRILNWADSEANWATTECVIGAANTRSIALANKLGFEQSGHSKERNANTYTRFNALSGADHRQHRRPGGDPKDTGRSGLEKDDRSAGSATAGQGAAPTRVV